MGEAKHKTRESASWLLHKRDLRYHDEFSREVLVDPPGTQQEVYGQEAQAKDKTAQEAINGTNN